MDFNGETGCDDLQNVTEFETVDDLSDSEYSNVSIEIEDATRNSNVSGRS